MGNCDLSSTFSCTDEESLQETFDLDIPEDVVNGSSRGYLIVTGKISN